MKSLRRIIIARRVIPALGVIGVMTLLGLLVNRVGLPIRIVSSGLTHKIPLVELVSLVCVILVVYLTRPQLWDWERLGFPRTKLISAGIAGLAIFGAIPPVAVVIPLLPQDRSWSWLIANALIVAGTAVLIAVLCGPLAGCFITFSLYLAVAITDNVVDGARPYLPLTSYPDSVAHWVPAAILPLSAVVGYALTHGRSPWVNKLIRNED